MMTPREIMALADRVERARSGWDEEISNSECLEALGYTVRPGKVWKDETRRWRSAPRILFSVTDAVGEVERQLHPFHPGMTMKVDMRWSSRDLYVTAEITWPSSERHGRSTDPCLAIVAALLRPKGNP